MGPDTMDFSSDSGDEAGSALLQTLIKEISASLASPSTFLGLDAPLATSYVSNKPLFHL